jgi:hypothetical protein
MQTILIITTTKTIQKFKTEHFNLIREKKIQDLLLSMTEVSAA